MDNQQSIHEIPKPRASKGGGAKMTALALLALALAGGMAYWLSRDASTQTALKNKVMEAVESTPLNTVAKYFTPPPPPPPPRVSAPPTRPGTLAGQEVQGAVPPPPPPEEGGVSPTPGAEPAVPTVREDSVVRPLFVEDLAQWLASRYQPGKDGGGVNWNLQSLNQRYGAQLRGFGHSGEDVFAGRAALLRYVFNTPMLTALYGLYADRFVEALERAARERALTPEQTGDMLLAYAGRFAALGGAVRGIASLEDFQARMAAVAGLAQRATAVHSQMAEAVFALDEARTAGDKSRMNAAQLRVDGLNAQYQRLAGERNAAQQSLLRAVRQAGSGAHGMDDGSLMFTAHWMERRLNHDPQSGQAIAAAAQLLEDLAARLRKAGSAAR